MMLALAFVSKFARLERRKCKIGNLTKGYTKIPAVICKTQL